jgi:hypothetical protein
VAGGVYYVARREPVPDDVVLAELPAATQAAVNHSRELLSIARRLLMHVEGGPEVPVETRADYWQRFAEMDAVQGRIQAILDRWPFLRAGPGGVQRCLSPDPAGRVQLDRIPQKKPYSCRVVALSNAASTASVMSAAGSIDISLDPVEARTSRTPATL